MGSGIVLTAGAGVERQEERSFNESESEFGPSSGSTDVERSNRAYYGQFLANVAGLTVVAGGRLDDNDAFGTFATYRAAAAYGWSNTRVRASVGKSFKAPTFLENFATGFAVGNPNLDPERSLSWELGLEETLFDNRLTLRGTYFDQTFKDLIQFSFADLSFANVAEAQASGLEFEVSLTPMRHLSLAGNYTHLKTEVIDAGLDSGEGATFVDGERLLRRPSNTVNASVIYRGWNRGVFTLVMHHVGDRDDRDFASFPASAVVLPAYTTVDLSAQIELLPRPAAALEVTGTLRVENVFDEQYAGVFGFPARGRTVFVGGRVSR